jgi:hypothetical protein
MFTSIACVVMMSAASAQSEPQVQRQEELARAAQYHEFSCGQNALFLLLRLLNRPGTLEEVRKHLHVADEGSSASSRLRTGPK